MFNKTRINLDNLNSCPFGFGHRRRHSPRVYPTAFRRWMQHSAKPAIGRWRLSLADRLGDEGRQRGTSLYRACGRGTEIAPSRLRAVASRRHGYLKAQSARCRTRLRESARRSDRLTAVCIPAPAPSLTYLAIATWCDHTQPKQPGAKCWANSAGSMIGLPKRKTTYLPCLQHHAREPRSSKPPPLQPINKGSGSPLLPWPANRNHNLAKTANLSVKFHLE